MGPKWFRRLATEGLSYCSSRNRPRLEDVARFFDLELKRLWEVGFVQVVRADAKRPPPELPDGAADCFDHLRRLLEHESGEYEYLKHLLKKLHDGAFLTNQRMLQTDDCFIMLDEEEEPGVELEDDDSD